MKLLNYSSGKYLWLSSIIIILSVPTFYFVIDGLVLNSVDENLNNEIALLPKYLKHIKKVEDIALWRTIDSDLEIEPFVQDSLHETAFTKSFYNSKSNEIEEFRYLQQKVTLLGKDYIISYKTSLLEKDDLLQSILIVEIILLIFLFIGFLIINRLISKKLWQPFNQILVLLKSYTLENPIKQVDTQIKIDEFNELNNEVKNLLQRTEKTYYLQKEFIENASHELQTPIAIIKFKLDLLLQDKNLTENQSRIIDHINQVINKLNGLNQSLLLLSKLDNQQYVFNQVFSANLIINKAAEDLGFIAEGKNQIISIQDDATFELKGNELLFGQIIHNLLINAIQYAPKSSVIEIEITKKQIIIKNKGVALNIKEEKLFERFAKNTSASNTGNGLGLAISKKIAQAHGLNLNYQYKDNQHQFNIYF